MESEMESKKRASHFLLDSRPNVRAIYAGMPNLHPPLKPAPQNWHVADIKCALEKKGWSLSRLSRKRGYSRNSCQMALYIPWPKMERIIADAIGVPPQTIWPSRYDEHGNSNRPRGRPKKNANTGRSTGVIPASVAE